MSKQIEVEGVGHFLELEILGGPQMSLSHLNHLLDTFKALFKDYPLENAILPYRDFVAAEYKKRLNLKKLKYIYFSGSSLENPLYAPLLERLKKEGVQIQPTPKTNADKTLLFQYIGKKLLANNPPITNINQILLILLALK